MMFSVRTQISIALCGLIALASPAVAQAPPWPERWFDAGADFGTLEVEYRLTNDCGISPDFEIAEYPRFEVTRGEILASLKRFLETNTRNDPPRDVLFRIFDEVLDLDRDPDQPLTQSEYTAVMAELEALGPWPRVRLAPVGRTTYRCTFDPSGTLVRVEQSATNEDDFTDFSGPLSEQGPFTVRWYIEE